MKKLFLIFVTAMSLIMGIVLTALAESKPTPAATHSTGNQLMQGYVHWYEKTATVKPAPEVAAKSGSLLILQTGSFLYLEGDSTLHKYQMNARSLLGSAVVNIPAGGDLLNALKAGKVASMVLTVPVKDLKSRESGLDDNAYKALNLKENPEIKFVLKNATLKSGKETGIYTLVVKGNLTIAGVTVPIVLSGDAIIKGNKIEFKGIKKLKMSDFKITPPSISLLVASINTTDEITIHYDIFFGSPAK
jgi:hypothetical protein